MGSRGTANITRGGGKPKKRSRFSPSEGVERGRIMAGYRRRKKLPGPPGVATSKGKRYGTVLNRIIASEQGKDVRAHHARREGRR